MRLKLLSLIISSGILFLSCNQQPKQSKIYNGIKTGSIQTIKARTDTSQSYLIYLPYSYKAEAKLPIIWAFDAHACADSIMNWLLPYAEQYNYIVVASRNFRNNVKNLDYILSTLLDDVASRVKYNSARQYTAGFSGGARIAYYLAAMDRQYKGVAMLSAGITPLKFLKNKDMTVIMFAGWKDFNLTEIRGDAQDLAKMYTLPYVTFYFNGTHQYPPHYLAEYVYLWFDANAAKKGMLKHKGRIITRIKTLTDSLVKATNDPMAKYDLYKAEKNMLQGLGSTKKIEKEIKELEESEAFKQRIKVVVSYFNLETMLRPQYYKALFTRDTSWWAHEINSYRTKLKEDTNVYRRYFYQRMLSYMGIMCYSVASNLLLQGKLDKADKVLIIYHMLEPNNPDVYLFRSCYWLSKGDIQKGLKYYQMSRKLGFDEPARLQQYPCFSKLPKQIQKEEE